MNELILTVVDTQRIQSYIFGTNQLAQNVGASFLVKKATEDWVIDALPLSHNVNASEHLSDEDRIENSRLQAEVVYQGGGNALILFRNPELAKEFARKLTTRALTEALGLQIVIAHSDPFDWEKDALGGSNGVVQRTMNRLARRKQNRPMNMPLQGLSVTTHGIYSGLPAVAHNKNKKPIAAEARAKIAAAEQAHQFLAREFDWAGYEIPKDFERFGRSEGERSYLAIVHADVNNMGMRVMEIRDRFSSPADNRTYVQAMRAFSRSMKQAAQEALQETIHLLAEHVQFNSASQQYEIIGRPDNDLHVPLYSEGDKVWIPFRPIVYGGDDVTFITDGRLGLSLAARYLEFLTAKKLVGPNGEQWPIHARAGIAVVKTHFPFARAYELTNSLVASAKAFIMEQNGECSALDWHFLTGSLLSDLTTLREREYKAGSKKWDLLMRPVALHADTGLGWRTWSNFEEITLAFQTDENWKDRRNKVKTLREVLRKGSPEAIQYFLSTYRLTALPGFPGSRELSEKGWAGRRTPYFDAIEAMDFFIPLKEDA